MSPEDLIARLPRHTPGSPESHSTRGTEVCPQKSVLSLMSVDRDATLLHLSWGGGGGCSRLLPPHRACKLARFIPPASRTYPTHLPRSLLTRGIVQGWRRESAVLGPGRRESDAQPPRTHSPSAPSAAPAHSHSDPILIRACHSQLGEYKTSEGKRKITFLALSFLQIVLNWPIACHFRASISSGSAFYSLVLSFLHNSQRNLLW